jgi:hypothetical protein
MNSWDIKQLKGGRASVSYKDLKSGAMFDCGTTPNECPLAAALQWVVESGSMTTGDFIRVGSRLHWVHPTINA